MAKPNSTHNAGRPKLKDDPAHVSERMSPPRIAESTIGPAPEPAATSFNSNGSAEPPRIFTPPDQQGGTSSNETSFQSTNPQFGSQDSYQCTQNTTEALDRSFHEATELMQADNISEPNLETPYLPELTTLGPFREPRKLFPPDLSFRKRYELLRVAQGAGLAVEDLISSSQSCGDDYQKLWTSISLVAAKAECKLPDRGRAEAWNLAHTSYQDDAKRKSVIFSGTLDWNKPGVPGLLHLQLKPLKLEESCRFHRAYGSDRFMSISMPSLSQTYLPDRLKHHYKALRASITEWISKGEHEIAGRKWKAFFVEGAKRRWRKGRNRDTEESRKEKEKEKTVNIQDFRIHLFAIDGIDFLNTNGLSLPERPLGSHTRISIESLLDWHIPIKANLGSTDLKAFQRFALGLSQTLPTVILEPSEFVHVEDWRNSPRGQVMNDGCARISGTLGRMVADQLDLEEVPSVFQARIAGAKGVWIVDHDELMVKKYPAQMAGRKFCVEVSDSQLKIKPHPAERIIAHTTQRTFEVVAWSTMPRPASLNFQILAILHDRGVSREVLKKLLLADQCQYHEALFRSMNHRVRLREWIEQNKMSVRDQDDIPLVGAWPDEIDEQIILFLESGFMPQDCPLLLERIRSCLERNLNRYVDKLQIRVPESAYLYCIADPYGILEPDEVHVGFSGTWKDLLTGTSTVILDGIDVLVARLPALLPSDIQRRKAVWHKELQHFRNVVVFSSKGEVPLADMLSGGDYDGDMPWLCWNKSIVEAFENQDVFDDLPSKEDCNLVKKFRPMSTVFSNVSSEPSRLETEDFFRSCFGFNLYPSLLGTCTFEHEMVSYEEGCLSHAGAKKLATLASYLVDSGKQGYFLSNQDWQKIRKEVSPRKRNKPAYKEKESTPQPKQSNIIDFLKFWVATAEKDKLLAEFHRRWPRKNSHVSDPILTSLWRTTKQTASEGLAKVLDQLQADVEAIGEEWLKGMPPDLKFENDGFKRMVMPLHQKFSVTQPLNGKHELSARWHGEIGEASCHWQLLRASYLYDKFPGRKMCWFLAGQDLCRIKLNATGSSRAVLLEIYKTYKPNKKVVKRIAGQEEDDAEEVGDY